MIYFLLSTVPLVPGITHLVSVTLKLMFLLLKHFPSLSLPTVFSHTSFFFFLIKPWHNSHVYGIRRFSFFACICTIFPTPFIEQLSFLHCMFCLLCQILVDCKDVQVIFEFSILFHWPICPFLCWHYAILITMAL